jgi:hypothetical protein
MPTVNEQEKENGSEKNEIPIQIIGRTKSMPTNDGEIGIPITGENIEKEKNSHRHHRG